MNVAGDLTQLLQRWGGGDADAANELAPLLYAELRRLAAAHLRREAGQPQLRPTELVSEAYVRLLAQRAPDWESRKHFYGVASRLMRQILVDYARTARAEKRGSGQVTVALDRAHADSAPSPVDMLHLDEALSKLEKLDGRKAAIVEQYYFAGLTADEIADVTGISAVTVRRDLRLASAWLRDYLRSR